MKEEKKNLKQIDEETLSHLDDEQLEEIAGGAKGDDPDDDNEDSCIALSCDGKAEALE